MFICAIIVCSVGDFMECVFSLDKFDGPLDLLLHLVKQADISIFDINISDITDQYLSYIKSINLNLNSDSEYMLMASDLLYMKARELVPTVAEEEEEDPKEALINRLLEYQKFKEISKDFKELEFERGKMFSKMASLPLEFHNDKALISDVSLDDLVSSLLKFYGKKELEKPLNTAITRKEYSVYKRGLEIKEFLKVKKKTNFFDMMPLENKDLVIVTFLAVLDLTKKGDILIEQNLGDIMIRLKEGVS